ncbi:MAG: alpha/beta hydrolase [Clostridia bacterium]|nr:alpha/beta hydrolase [Clostridia bacterium]
MRIERIRISGIPALVWGDASDHVWLCVHGKMGSKEAAEGVARIAAECGCQTLSFDLAEHGDRKGEPTRCDVFSGVRDLTAVADYAFGRWREVSLFACSLGAYFSLQALSDRPFRKCLFQSPILDMEHLIRRMFLWFNVTPERLMQEREIATPVDPLRWDYYQYVITHPVLHWPMPTGILYGGRDDLQSPEVVEGFASRFGCHLTVAESSAHPFMDEGDAAIVERWLRSQI